MQSVCSNPCQGSVIEDNLEIQYVGMGLLLGFTHHGVCVLCQASHTQQAVVWLDDDVAVLCVGKDTVCLDKLLWESVVQSFEHV